METLSKKIEKINEEYDRKQANMLEKLAEERRIAIASETVNDTVEKCADEIEKIFDNI